MNKLDGKKPPIRHFYGDPDTPSLPKEVLKEMWKAAYPRLGKKIGKIIIMGTGGEINE